MPAPTLERTAPSADAGTSPIVAGVALLAAQRSFVRSSGNR
jgi:hypothetical protein